MVVATIGSLATLVTGYLAVVVSGVAVPLLFTLALALCAAIASRTILELDERLLLDGSFSVMICAAATVGPAGALLVAIAAEVSAWEAERYRFVAFPSNLFGSAGPLILAAFALTPMRDEGGPYFFAAVVAIGLVMAFLNGVIVSLFSQILDRGSLFERLNQLLKMTPAVGLSIACGAVAVAIYRAEGILAAGLLLGSVVAFAYFTNQMFAAQKYGRQVALLAESRAQLVMQLMSAEERERRLLADAIHDDAIQNLLAARQDLRDAERGNAHRITRARIAVDRAVAHLRVTVGQLHPTILAHVGLQPALVQLADDHGRRSEVDITVHPNPIRLNEAAEQLTFSLAREFLTNAIKHAGASTIQVTISATPGSVELLVADDGSGIPAGRMDRALATGHIGLASARERIEAVGGTFDIATSRAQGTAVKACLPDSFDEGREPSVNVRHRPAGPIGSDPDSNGPSTTERRREPAALR